MKFKTHTLPLVTLVLLSACGQEPNAIPSPAPTSSPIASASPLQMPDEPKSTPSPLPTSTPEAPPLTQVEIENITPESLNEENQNGFGGLALKNTQKGLTFFITQGTKSSLPTLLKIAPKSHIKQYERQDFNFNYGNNFHSITNHPLGIILVNNNCLELFSSDTQSIKTYSCSSFGKIIQEIYTDHNNELYTFGEFFPQDVGKKAGYSSAYHLSQYKSRTFSTQLLTTAPVGGAFLIEDPTYSSTTRPCFDSEISWGIKVQQRKVNHNNCVLRRVNNKNIVYFITTNNKTPSIRVSSISDDKVLPHGTPSKIPYIQDGTVAQATLWQPHHLTVDSQQNVYFIDQFITQNKRFSYIRHIAQGQVKTLIAQTGSTGEFFPQADFYLSDLSSNATPDQYADYITLIALDETDQTLYIATSKGELFSFDLDTQKLTLISQEIPTDLKELEVGPEGDLYAINDSSLFHIRIPESLKTPETDPS